MCGRPRVAPGCAWASTVSIVTGMPAEAIFSTMRTIRVSRLARACSISRTRSGFSGSMR